MKLNVGTDPMQGLQAQTEEQLQAHLARMRSNAAVPRPPKKQRRQGSRSSSRRAAVRDHD